MEGNILPTDFSARPFFYSTISDWAEKNNTNYMNCHWAFIYGLL
jgi:hypothetical protein